MELRMGIDEREEEEQEANVEGIPFIISNDVIDIYGSRYSIDLDENKLPQITALDK